jgi:hypothetical protein
VLSDERRYFVGLARRTVIFRDKPPIPTLDLGFTSPTPEDEYMQTSNQLLRLYRFYSMESFILAFIYII